MKTSRMDDELMKIDWTHETFASGLEITTTQFRGLFVEIRREPTYPFNQVWARIYAVEESDSLDAQTYSELNKAMIESLKWINHYWDQMEDGPGAVYEQIQTEDL